ncbi:hypothetical protein GUJ93_ZPchr0252g33447 [Zizania palustris]|uniref:Uncharacterized protein n=1 Tax=Zizania palustris TaxID=103762 RepID=A0A8J5R2U3_ZIZPA|nr:hypothetical protein GUJ93_ZPchr0252g33447 [Zizania palustris]
MPRPSGGRVTSQIRGACPAAESNPFNRAKSVGELYGIAIPSYSGNPTVTVLLDCLDGRCHLLSNRII